MSGSVEICYTEQKSNAVVCEVRQKLAIIQRSRGQAGGEGKEEDKVDSGTCLNSLCHLACFILSARGFTYFVYSPFPSFLCVLFIICVLGSFHIFYYACLLTLPLWYFPSLPIKHILFEICICIFQLPDYILGEESVFFLAN